MTLDFKKLIRNAVKKQMAIQHFECNVQIFKNDELPEQVKAKIQSVKGEDFLNDANYTLWFSGNNITKETVEKTIFKIMNKSCGEAANDSSEKDLIMIDLGGTGSDVPPPENTVDTVDSIADASADDANAKAVGDLVNPVSDDSDDVTMNDVDDDADEADDLDESVESPTTGEKFAFVKITMK